MPEPITLALVGTLALTEGMKFLYNQAGEILKRWRETRQQTKPQTEAPEPVQVQLPDVFEGQLVTPAIHFDAVEKFENEMRQVRRDLSDYATGVDSFDNPDEDLLKEVDALRQMLEAVYQQRITFKGEERQASGPLVDGRIDVGTVAGYVTAIRARRIKAGKVVADARANRVEAGAELIGLEADTIGE